MTLRVLASFHYFRTVDMAELVEDLTARYGGPVKVFADSGAFSAINTGASVDLAGYAAWLTRWAPFLTVAATLDVIGDHEATARNTAALHDAGHPVLPTFHVGTPWPVLEALCARHPYIALGGMVPHSRNPGGVLRWLIKAFRIAAPHGTRFHGFGQTTQNTTAALPFYSVDSSTWGTGARHGRIPVWDETTHRLRDVIFGRADQVRRHAARLTAQGLDPVAFARPGYAQRAQRDKDTYLREWAAAVGGSAAAWQHYSSHLQARHQVPAPPGHDAPGTVVYLAEGGHEHMRMAASHLATLRKAPHP